MTDIAETRTTCVVLSFPTQVTLSGDWAIALTDYATHQRAGGRSPGTIRLHRYYLSRLAAVAPGPWSVSTRDLLTMLAVDHWAPETRKSARSVLRAFYRWAHLSGAVAVDPTLALPSVRVPHAVPRPAPENVVQEALARCDPRAQVMIRLGAYCGLRAAEIARVSGRDLVGDELMVLGKGGKLRAVPVLDETLLSVLRETPGYLFPSQRGGHVTPGHVTKLLSAALPDGWTAHTLRHRMATRAYAGTRDLLAVGAVLGHSRPETTQRYVRLPDDAIRAAVRAAA